MLATPRATAAPLRAAVAFVLLLRYDGRDVDDDVRSPGGTWSTTRRVGLVGLRPPERERISSLWLRDLAPLFGVAAASAQQQGQNDEGRAGAAV
jgi:hypothetical protein